MTRSTPAALMTTTGLAMRCDSGSLSPLCTSGAIREVSIRMEIDRSKWAPGPWDAEPDRLDWREGGFPCFAQRNAMGAWCGYVGVPEGHWAFEKQYGVVNVDVHGGLTYSEHCQGHICHVPPPRES